VVANRLRAAATSDDPAAGWSLADPRKGELGAGRRIVDVHVRATLGALLREIQAAAVIDDVSA
jgi:hypothetical protein